MAQHHGEQPEDADNAWFIAELNPELGEVHLRLATWRGLETNLEATPRRLVTDRQRVETIDAGEAHLAALKDLAAAPAEPKPPAAEAKVLDITQQDGPVVRH